MRAMNVSSVQVEGRQMATVVHVTVVRGHISAFSASFVQHVIVIITQLKIVIRVQNVNQTKFLAQFNRNA